MAQFEAGNPGRPKGAVNRTTAQMKAFLEPYADDILGGLVEMARGTWTKIPDPDKAHDPQAMLDVYIHAADDEKVRFWALQELANRLWGKPRQSVDVGMHQRSLADLMNAEDEDTGEEG